MENQEEREERPLSPVLINKRINKRHRLSKQSQKKSRINLTDRFNSSEDSNILNSPFQDSFTQSQTENLFKSIEETETVESEQKSHHNIRDCDFKKPISLTSRTSKKSKCEGFNTAGGNSIALSDDSIKKHSLLFDDILNPSQETLKSGRNVKNSFLKRTSEKGDENLDGRISKNDCIGFQTASGGKLKISESAVEKAENLFSSESGNKIEISETAIQRVKNLFGDGNKDFGPDSTFGGFKKASGDKVAISANAVKSVENLFSSLESNSQFGEFQKVSENKNQNCSLRSQFGGFQRASGNKIKVSESATKHAKGLFANLESDSQLDESKASKKASTSETEISEAAVGYVGDLFPKEFDFNEAKSESGGFMKASTGKVEISKSAFDKVQTIFTHEKLDGVVETKTEQGDLSFKGFDERTIEDSVQKIKLFFASISELNQRGIKRSRGHLSDLPEPKRIKNMGFETAGGCLIGISEESLEKAEGVFDMSKTHGEFKSISEIQKIEEFSNLETSQQQDSLTDSQSQDSLGTFSNSSRKISSRKRLGITPLKPSQISKNKLDRARQLFEDKKLDNFSYNNQSVFSSTPVKLLPLCSTPTKVESSVLLNSTLTPIRNVKIVTEASVCENRVVFRAPTKGNIDLWGESLETEQKALQLKLNLLMKRSEILKFQKFSLESKEEYLRKPRLGILLKKKTNSERISLRNYFKLDSPSDLTVTPQNAELVHFNCLEHASETIKTQDGAVIVPNIKNLVGLSEIEVAFKVMPGVDPKLIPNGWIRNHYKWIVWKLASYEMFISNLDCLNIENIIQQLKYRYDREIDRAERPTLRKIFEKDDVPQKRMVLCVSDILKLTSNKVELELSDGWYSIRTTIDHNLTQQVRKGTIKIGTKLIISGAELLDCDGCYPLDATDLVRLKINSNSSRRVQWDVKLGYQKFPEPFPVKLNSVIPTGGVIACCRVYVARVYPVKYLEKKGKLSVWRNKKAEERRAQEWESERSRRIEEIHEVVRRDYEKSIQARTSFSANNKIEIKHISCPKTLYDLYQSSNDPDSFQELLTQDQREAIMEYQRNQSYVKQQELNEKIQDRVNNMELNQRDVTPVLKLIVLDALKESLEKGMVLQIWKPLESHLEIIKEGVVFDVHNLRPKDNGTLNSTNQTKFFRKTSDTTKFNKFKRTFTPIEILKDVNYRTFFNEFDTVGIAVQISSSCFTQHLWLSDLKQRLLFIKIFEGSKNCSLLDNVKEGQIVAVSNLILCKPKLEFSEAVANHSSIISCYPQQKYLQDEISILSESLPKDMSSFLDECNYKISLYVDKLDLNKDLSSKSLINSNEVNFSDVFNDTFEESTDVALSLIDIDKLN